MSKTVDTSHLEEIKKDLQKELKRVEDQIEEEKQSEIDWQSVADLIADLQSKHHKLRLTSEVTIPCAAMYNFELGDIVRCENYYGIKYYTDIRDAQSAIQNTKEHSDAFKKVVEKSQELRSKIITIKNRGIHYSKIVDILRKDYNVKIEHDVLDYI